MARRRRPPRAGALTELPPLRILSQIAALQGMYYAAALVLMLFTTLVLGRNFSLDFVFGWSRVRGDTTDGWLMAFIWILDGALIVSLGLVVFVMRSKLVPDFAISLHAIHLAVTFLYTGKLPRHTLWWLAMFASTGCAVALGMWGCQYRELKPISFGGIGGGSTNTHSNTASGAAASAGGGGGEGSSSRGGADAGGADGGHEAGDEEQGFSRGRGRGRGRDSRGEYEMVKLNGNGEAER